MGLVFGGYCGILGVEGNLVLLGLVGFSESMEWFSLYSSPIGRMRNGIRRAHKPATVFDGPLTS